MDKLETRGDFCDKAKSLTGGDRHKEHVDFAETYERVARIIEIILGIPISVPQTLLIMEAVKLGRKIDNLHNLDNIVDTIGYNALLGEYLVKHYLPLREKNDKD